MENEKCNIFGTILCHVIKMLVQKCGMAQMCAAQKCGITHCKEWVLCMIFGWQLNKIEMLQFCN